MRITADTNVLLRTAVQDNPAQAHAAMRLLSEAEFIFVSLPCLCEFAWVLGRVYKMSKLGIALSIETLLSARNVVTDRPAVEAGLAMLYAGGDFADGILAWEGRQAGADTFASFDKEAVKLLSKQGYTAKLLS